MLGFRGQLAALGLMLLVSAGAQASNTPYQLYPALDVPVLSVSAVAWLGTSLFQPRLVDADGCRCRAAEVNGLDRGTAGNRSLGWSVTGDLLTASACVAVVLFALAEVVQAGEPISDFLTDIAVIAEAVLLNGALTQLTKIAVARPRPLLYGRALDDPFYSEPDNYVSFYSAHTSVAFALGLAYAQTFAYRHPDSPYRWLVYTGAAVFGSVVGATRIAAGKHFPSDVLVGALAGSAFGLLIPWLHRRDPEVQLSVIATPQALGLSFTLHAH